MEFKSLLNKFETQEVFIYGKSVIQIVEMKTYIDNNQLKSDFIYHTDRNRRGIITITHKDKESENLALTAQQKHSQELS